MQESSDKIEEARQERLKEAKKPHHVIMPKESDLFNVRTVSGDIRQFKIIKELNKIRGKFIIELVKPKKVAQQ